MAQPVDSFIRTQGLICAVLNMVINPALAWLTNRRMDDVPLVGGGGLVVDTAVTCVVLSLLVSLFTTAGVRQALRAGQLVEQDGPPGAGLLLSRLPRSAWGLGLALGIGIACIIPPLAYVLFSSFGAVRLPFATFALYKLLYTGPLGYAVTRWVILRQVQPSGRPRP